MRFVFHLARELGLTVAELGQRMTVMEFEQWKALYRLEAKEREKAEKQRKKGKRHG